MSDQQSNQTPGGRSEQGERSEAGSSTANLDASLGGADAVPDTPDVNDTGEGDAIDTAEQGDEPARRQNHPRPDEDEPDGG